MDWIKAVRSLRPFLLVALPIILFHAGCALLSHLSSQQLTAKQFAFLVAVDSLFFVLLVRLLGFSLSLVRDLAIIGLNTLVVMLGLNFVFVYFAPDIVPGIPRQLIRKLPVCYRTFYPEKLASSGTKGGVEVVFGDSYSEGLGDEYLANSRDYGIFNKLNERGVTRRFVVYGRSGYGNLGTVAEARFLEPLVNKYTRFSYDNDKVKRVTFAFYEGNDLNNNLVELQRNTLEADVSGKKQAFFFPLFDMLWRSFQGAYAAVYLHRPEIPADAFALGFPVSRSGVELVCYPQSAATQLTEEELDVSLSALQRMMAEVKAAYPNAQCQLLYIPAVVSCYRFEGNVPVESYNSYAPFITTDGENEKRHNEIVGRVKAICAGDGWLFCDPTEDIRRQTVLGKAVHGPRDGQHFNALGYTVVADAYMQSFEEGDGSLTVQDLNRNMRRP